MISNNTSYKLKASKSSKDINDYQDNPQDENYETESVDGDATGDSNRKYSYFSKDGWAKGARTRHTAFKTSRSSERRGPYRGRGGMCVRRSDREFSDTGFVVNRKVQDNLNRNYDLTSSYHYSKNYENDKKNDVKLNLPEDLRISKLLRHLSMENNPDISLAISKKLLEVLMLTDNASYVRKSFNILGDSVLDILQSAPGLQAKSQVARCLGRMGYIMGQENDFERFQKWIFSKMNSCTDEISFLFMIAFKETLALERKRPVLQKHSGLLIRELTQLLEVLDNVKVFKATLDNVMSLAEMYPDEFYPQLRDIADVLIGWHLDSVQSLSTIQFISQNLQRISKHFQANLDFSIQMVINFLEDIGTYKKQLRKKDHDCEELTESTSLEHTTLFISSLNTILKCLGDKFKTADNEFMTQKIVVDCLTEVIDTAIVALEAFVPDNLTIAANECISVLLVSLGAKPVAINNAVFSLIDLELSLTKEFADSTIISMLLMISVAIKELSANIPIELIAKLVGPNSEIIKLRYSPYSEVQEAVVSVYQSLLNIKNIPLLQEAYKYILGDFEISYRELVPEITLLNQNNPFTNIVCSSGEIEYTLMFLLRCFSQLATTSGSIICMWAIQPSILEFLARVLEPVNISLYKSMPALQYSLLYLLYSHSKCYQHYISISDLVSDGSNLKGHHSVPENFNSNSGNFGIILNMLLKSLSCKTNYETTLFLLQWFSEILLVCESFLERLYKQSIFISLANVLVNCGYSKNEHIITAVYTNLNELLNNKQLAWKNTFLTKVSDLCILHMKSNNKHIRHCYSTLYLNIPWDIAIVELAKNQSLENVTPKQSDINDYNNYTITLAQHLHNNGSIYGDMQPLQFKMFMKYLLNNETIYLDQLEDIFNSCWPIDSDPQIHTEQFRELAINSRVVLNNWLTWEAAQLCINTKLRTPLGKPNETFTSFESCLKQLAKDIMKINSNCESLSSPNIDPRRINLLLQFMEHLEMSIYNASEGCALAIPQCSKPVRTFFSTNSSTCREWLSRIRIVLIQLALHAGQSAIAYRHAESFLKDSVANNKIHTNEFDSAVLYATIALLNLREAEALQGLYFWCMKSLQKTFDWLKPAIDQANKKFEIAAEKYEHIYNNLPKNEATTSDSKTSSMSHDKHLKTFIGDQIINCYKELNNWEKILDWNHILSRDVLEFENNIDFSFRYMNADTVEKVVELEKADIVAFNALATWDYADSWSSYDTHNNTESILYDIALNISNSEYDLKNKIYGTLTAIENTIQDELMSLPSDFLQQFCLLNYVASGLKNLLNDNYTSVFLVSEDFESEINKIDSCILSKVLWWSEYFASVQKNGFNIFCNNLRLNIVKKARKEKNVNLACSQLYKFLQDRELLDLQKHSESQVLLKTVGNKLINAIPDIHIWSLDTAKAVTEFIKLLYNDPDSKHLTYNLCAISSTAISKFGTMNGIMDLLQVSSRILLKLATWLQSNDQVSLTDMNSPLGKFLMVLPEIGMLENSHSNVIPMNEMAIGKLLQFSVQHCTTLAKAWNAFGTWCYRWGRKIVDSSYDLGSTLSEENRIAIQNVLPRETTEGDLNRVFQILSQSRSAVEDEDIDSNEINTSEMIYNQLQNIPALSNIEDSQLQQLIYIWRKIQKRIYSYYEISAEAYFRYLHLVTNSENVSKSAEYNTVTITLRLLRLIVRHALELQNVLENGLQSTPTHPWKIIIPQLFSRLNHPEIYVRQRVSELLCRVAEDAPHLITFPAVVGALEGGVKFDFSEISLPKDCLSQNNDNAEDAELNEIDEIDDSDNEDSKNVLRDCFKSMVDTLSKQAPDTITQVQLLVKELRRIILLWDELWLGTLNQHHSEINKRQQQLEIEIEKVTENQNLKKEEKISLIAEKHRIIIKPIIYILEQLCDITSVEPETPHEKKFQEKYSDFIKEVIGKLKNPENPDKPQESWHLLKQLQMKFQHNSNKRISYSLKMQEISPVLHGLKNTVISMPGLATSTRKHITISHLSNHVSILPTKTKPKKLVFHGSDGQTYTYLFKGLEDLHLDERIMQFLSIANTMMAQITNGPEGNLYRARHYSVIPLGPRSGLISWVDGTTPLFALYKRWQQREASKVNFKATTTSSVLRPSDLFYNKLNPLLQESGVKNIENRKEWPLSVLKKVLTDLMSETPSDLLGKELWCHSINAGAWWQMVRKYTYSVAVMSIIGYIIGLGDRHLDNVLIDLTSGEVIHIDYNVCFEKGKTLRVPEKVPFRLTPNIRDALGVTGVEGTFRCACENVLRTMKKGRETLLTLLEAFVYDPLVDWTVGGEGLAGTTFGGVTSSSSRQSRKNLEREVTFSMYNVRCTELKVEWAKNKTNILEIIPHVKETLHTWQEKHKKTKEIEDSLHDLHQQMALVKEAEANGIAKHSLYSLPSRYESFRKTQEVFNSAKQNLLKIISDCELHNKKYSDALKYMDNQQLSQWIIQFSVAYDSDVAHVFDLVKEFLQNAGQASMIAQCEQSENEVSQLIQQQSIFGRKCLSLLQEYAAVLSQCPISYTERHRAFCFLKWSKYLLESMDPNACDVVYQQFLELINSTNSPQAATITKFASHLRVVNAEVMGQLSKLCDEYAKFHNDNAINNLEKLYNDAKMSITTFLGEAGSIKAFEFVIVGELLVLNKSFLQLETAASRSGEWLIKLKGRDGDWYLDEVAHCCSKALEYISYLLVQQNSKIENTKFLQVVSGLNSCNNIYKVLQELNINFHTIILPESIRKIQTEEPTVIHMIAELNNIIRSVNMPLSDIILQLEKHISCIVMKMDDNTSFDFIVQKVSDMKRNFKELLNSLADDHSQGNMLLIGFSGLFEKLNIEMNKLIATIGLMEVPVCWRKIDHVKEAKSMATPIYNMKIKAVLDDIFFVKQLQSMSEFFNLCLEMCQSFAGRSLNVVVLQDEQLSKPIKKFISDFISKQFLGISTEMIAYIICLLLQNLGLDVTNEIEQKDIGAENKVPLDDIYNKGWTTFVKNGLFTHNIAAQASSLVSNLKAAWDKLQEPKKINHNIVLLKSSALRLQTQTTAVNWLYEDILSHAPNNSCSFVRSKFMLDLKNDTAALNKIYSKVKDAYENQKALIGSAGQRLRWAAGANPDLNEVLSAFETTVATREQRLEMELGITNIVVTLCKTILQHELLRNQTPEAASYDKMFITTFDHWKSACSYKNMNKDNVSALEENIMQLYTPEMATNVKWVVILSEKISELISSSQKQLQEQKEKTLVAYDSISSVVENFKEHYSQHLKLMADFKLLLKSMTKIEECSYNAQEFIMYYCTYINNFKSFFQYYKNDINVNDVEMILEKLNYLETYTEFIYDTLMDLELSDKQHYGMKPPTVKSDCDSGIVLKLTTNKPVAAKGQQKNSYAVNVWRRVRMKLEGRDPDPGRKYSIQEQVDFVIREATSLENLALLYEGWTPWV